MLKKWLNKNQWNGMLAMLVLFMFSFSPQQDTQLSEAEKKGRQIFMEGTSPDGREVFALLSDIKVPASVLACATCHGKDGTGKAEGGVVPSNITWSALTANYDGERKSARTHPPYDEKSLKRAISMGFDPAGNALNTAMPKYQMSHEDLSNLVAYLKVLGKETTTGVEDTQIHIGMLPSLNKGANELNQATEQVTQAYFSEINNKGGIYGRRLQLHVPNVEKADNENKVMNSFLDGQPLFAMINSFYPNAIQEGNNTEDQLPVIGAIDPFPIHDFSRNRHLFYLYPGLDGLAKGLVTYAQDQNKNETITVIYQVDEIRKGLADLIEKTVSNPVKMIPVEVTTPGNTLTTFDQLKVNEVENLFVLLAPHSERELIIYLSNLGWSPNLFLLGNLTQIDPAKVPAIFNEKITLAYPTWVNSANQKGRDYYRFLRDKYHLPARFQQSQMSALASAILLVESLENAGRKLTRYTLVEHLEKVYEFDSGLIPPLTYGPNRRVGSDLVYIVQLQTEQPRLTLVKTLNIGKVD